MTGIRTRQLEPSQEHEVIEFRDRLLQLPLGFAAWIVTPVAGTLKARNVPFVIASAYEKPERLGGAALAGAPNVGKPTIVPRLLAASNRLTNPELK